ncbi:MAG: prolyl oligopeptidase family serine peptidase [Planctomycetota bacterium]|nr:prolyl oligopeptidase family serine peptidase [Planctomycetota bacterium]
MNESGNVVSYREPPHVVVDVLDAPPTPALALSPDGKWILFVEHAAMPTLVDVARPMLRLGGLRIDPATDAHHQTLFGHGVALHDLRGEIRRRLPLPKGRRISSIRWSSDSRRFACLMVDERGTSLWCADIFRAEFELVIDSISAVLTNGFEWMPDGVRLLASRIPRSRGEKPLEPALPRGPKVLEARGDTTPLRTYQDLLASEHDERLFEHFTLTELVVCDPTDGSVESLGDPRFVWDFDASPDGRWVLVTTIERSFSYVHPYTGFPQSIEAWSIDGKERCVICSVPTSENIPIEGVRTGPRSVMWSAHGDANLVWLEALDGGDPRRVVPHRDRWMELSSPFDGRPRELARLEHRASGLSWTRDGALLAREYDRDRRWTRLRMLRAGESSAAVTLDDRSVRDRYGDPGSILFEPEARGRRIVRQRAEWIYRAGAGDSPTGPRPFLARQSLTTLATERMFESKDDEIEVPVTLLDDPSGNPVELVTRHESAVSPPNLRLRRFGSDAFEWLTHFKDPAPILRELKKELITYTRADGVQLSGELYLPPHWNGERLPIVLWAYPDDYVDNDTASQVTASKHRFTRISGPSHLFFALLGYAVLDDASMPIVGSPETMNDTFVEQITSSARAAIEKLDAMGVGDPARVGVGGHSYGAFMTACLLAHSTLFKAGIAKSGAYNRTLTPFGFQAERRTLWEAPDSYLKLSPFLSAHTIRAPLLLVHGERDENPGTHYLQTERLFHAIQGIGGIARFVSLPHEGHGYRARESILHVLAEQIEWFERYVKGV